MSAGRSILALLSALLLCSCADRAVSARLDKAEALMDERPDSALALVRSVAPAELRTRPLRARHALLHAMALDKNYIDTTDIAIVMPAVEYYERHGSADDRMKALYYLGRIHENRGEKDDAFVAVSCAGDCIQDAVDDRFKGLVCSRLSLLYAQAHNIAMEEAYAEKALYFFDKASDTERYYHEMYYYASVLQDRREWTRADSLYQTAMSYRIYPEWLTKYAQLMLFQTEAEPQRAVDILEKKKAITEGNLSDRDKSLYAFALLLLGDEKASDRLLSEINLEENKALRYDEYRIAKQKGDLERALSLLTAIYRDQDDDVDMLLSNSAERVLQEYYHGKEIEGTHRRQILTIRFSVILTGAVLFILALILISRRIHQRKNERIGNLLSTNEEMKQIIQEAEGQNSVLEGKIQDLRSFFVRYHKGSFDELGRLCETYQRSQDRSDREAVVYRYVEKMARTFEMDDKAQKALEEQINDRMDGIISHLREDLEDLSKAEERLFCYRVMGLSPATIAALSNTLPTTVYARRSKLRARISRTDSPYKDRYLMLL